MLSPEDEERGMGQAVGYKLRKLAKGIVSGSRTDSDQISYDQ